MKIKKIINRLDLLKVQKNLIKKPGRRNQKVSVMYCDLDPGSIKIRHLAGIGLRYRKRGLNSKLKIAGAIQSMGFQQIFFIHGPHFIDFKFSIK